MLTGSQYLDHFVQAWKLARLRRQPGQQHAHLTVQRIDLADCFNARVIFRYATSVA
ncbi:hypothetical protein OKW11_001780 [Pseudomonas baetica]|nr:hypothetical protein [Pseudomonas baetica]